MDPKSIVLSITLNFSSSFLFTLTTHPAIISKIALIIAKNPPPKSYNIPDTMSPNRIFFVFEFAQTKDRMLKTKPNMTNID